MCAFLTKEPFAQIAFTPNDIFPLSIALARDALRKTDKIMRLSFAIRESQSKF